MYYSKHEMEQQRGGEREKKTNNNCRKKWGVNICLLHFGIKKIVLIKYTAENEEGRNVRRMRHVIVCWRNFIFAAADFDLLKEQHLIGSLKLDADEC